MDAHKAEAAEHMQRPTSVYSASSDRSGIIVSNQVRGVDIPCMLIMALQTILVYTENVCAHGAPYVPQGHRLASEQSSPDMRTRPDRLLE